MSQKIKEYVDNYGKKELFNFNKLEGYLMDNNVDLTYTNQLLLILKCSSIKDYLNKLDTQISAVEINNVLINCEKTTGLSREIIKKCLYDIFSSCEIACSYSEFYCVPDDFVGDKVKHFFPDINKNVNESFYISDDEINEQLIRAELLKKSQKTLEAIELYHKLAKSGSAKAMYELGLMCLESYEMEIIKENGPSFFDKMISSNAKKDGIRTKELGMYWIEAAAKNGEPRACEKMGDYYYSRYEFDTTQYKALEMYSSPGVLTINPRVKERIVNILNQKRINLLVLSASGVLLLLMWVFLFVVNVSVHHTSNILGLGIPMTILSTIIYALSWGYYKMTVYNNVKWFSVLMLLFWSIYPLVLAIN